ncbi:MAG: SpoIID/LytB domain-containing protein [Cryomorphaceae bacterium]|jgi:stage II sporulation protein D|nr:SpoIID/LytB domain-containing protein [Cryomorphaceae bacterium]
MKRILTALWILGSLALQAADREKVGLMPTVRVRLYSVRDVYEFKAGGTALTSIWYRRGEAPDTLESSNLHVRRSAGSLQGNVDGSWQSADSIRIGAAAPISTEGPVGIRRTYPGELVFLPLGSTELLVVNRVPLEDYVAGVINAELGKYLGRELWRAQATVARTWWAANQRKFAAEGYQVSDDVRSQVYHGWPGDSARRFDLVEAAYSTEGLVLLRADTNAFVETLFHANSGGELMPAAWYFKDSPHLVNKPDSFSLDCPQTFWTKRVSASEWVGFVARTWGVSAADSDLREAVFAIDQPHRREFLEWNGKKIRFRTLREKFALRSSWFSTELDGGEVVVRGRGYGHGIGLSQEGAWRMAQLGYGFRAILEHYYPGARLEVL